MQSYLGRVYLDWSSWPLVNDIGPAVPPDAPPGAPSDTAINFRDLRFMYDTSLIQGHNNPPLSGMVYVGADQSIVSMELGGRVQR
jgi:inner membrane protein